MLHSRCRLIVGVDLSDKTVQAARAKFPHVRFETVDGFDLEALQALSPTGEFDKVGYLFASAHLCLPCNLWLSDRMLLQLAWRSCR